MIPVIGIWRAASLMLNYGEKALEESAACANELFAEHGPAPPYGAGSSTQSASSPR